MWAVFLVLGIILGVLAVAAPGLLGSVGFLGQAGRDKAGRLAGDAGPQAQLDQALAKGLDAIAKAKADLEAEKELVVSSQRRVNQNTAEATRLANRIKAALGDGDPHGTSKEYALSLAHVREQLASNTEQLAKHKANYEAFAQKVQIGQRQVQEAKQKAKDAGIALQESEHEARLATFAEDFSVGEVAGQMGDAMSQLQDRIYANKAKTAVADDMHQQSTADAKNEASEQQAKAEAILAEFKK